MVRKQKSENLFAFSSWFKYEFPWSKEEKKDHNITVTFYGIVSIHPSLFFK